MSSNIDNDLRVVTLHPEDITVQTLCTSHLNTEGLSDGGRDTVAHHTGGHSRGTLQGRRENHQHSDLTYAGHTTPPTWGKVKTRESALEVAGSVKRVVGAY